MTNFCQISIISPVHAYILVIESYVEEGLSSEILIEGEVGEQLSVKVVLNFFPEEILQDHRKSKITFLCV